MSSLSQSQERRKKHLSCIGQRVEHLEAFVRHLRNSLDLKQSERGRAYIASSASSQSSDSLLSSSSVSLEGGESEETNCSVMEVNDPL